MFGIDLIAILIFLGLCALAAWAGIAFLRR